MGIKFRLIAMNFLQYAIWGSWLISLGAYLGGGLDFSGLQIGSFFATMGIASLCTPDCASLPAMEVQVQEDIPARFSQLEQRLSQDRKSTRLNSSHAR